MSETLLIARKIDDGIYKLNDGIYVRIEKVVELKKKLKAENEQLKAKLESVQASSYADSVDAGMRERRLRRALYKACVNWALSTLGWLDCVGHGEPRKWSKMIQKCLKKAELYR